MFHQRPCRCERKIASRADRDDSVIRLDDLARSRNNQGLFPAEDSEKSLELPEIFVRAPELCQLDRSPEKIAVILLQLILEPFKERERIRRGAGETGENRVVVNLPDFPCRLLHDGIANGNLPVGADYGFPFVTKTDDGRGVYDVSHSFFCSCRD